VKEENQVEIEADDPTLQRHQYSAPTLETCRAENLRPWLSWHTFRRTHATLLQLAGGSLKDAQAQLGHFRLSTTLEIYTIPLPAHRREAVANLSQLVTSGDEFSENANGLPMPTQQIQ
jgi:integrase